MTLGREQRRGGACTRTRRGRARRTRAALPCPDLTCGMSARVLESKNQRRVRPWMVSVSKVALRTCFPPGPAGGVTGGGGGGENAEDEDEKPVDAAPAPALLPGVVLASTDPPLLVGLELLLLGADPSSVFVENNNPACDDGFSKRHATAEGDAAVRRLHCAPADAAADGVRAPAAAAEDAAGAGRGRRRGTAGLFAEEWVAAACAMRCRVCEVRRGWKKAELESAEPAGALAAAPATAAEAKEAFERAIANIASSG